MCSNATCILAVLGIEFGLVVFFSAHGHYAMPVEEGRKTFKNLKHGLNNLEWGGGRFAKIYTPDSRSTFITVLETAVSVKLFSFR